jgi:hypothetical protein
MRIAILIATLCGTPLIAAAHPGFIDGAALKANLESARRVQAGKAGGDDTRKAQFVYGYISGIVDSLNNDTSGRYFCQPPSVTAERDAEIILNYIDAHPALMPLMLPGNGTLYVFDALGEAFPCTRKR